LRVLSLEIMGEAAFADEIAKDEIAKKIPLK
jgi:hypothetical protein